MTLSDALSRFRYWRCIPSWGALVTIDAHGRVDVDGVTITDPDDTDGDPQPLVCARHADSQGVQRVAIEWTNGRRSTLRYETLVVHPR